jgi:hypothetical protein
MTSRTTLILPDELMSELKRRAAERGETLSSVVEETLRRGLDAGRQSVVVEPLPSYPMGRPMVDIAHREGLYRAMEKAD